MLVTTEKLPTKNIIENACPDCDGTGKNMVVPYALDQNPFETECGHCLGEKVISEDLLIRKNAGKALRSLLNENDLTIREASQKFSQSFREWNDAVRGKANADDIKAKIALIENSDIPPAKSSGCVFTRLRGYPL